MIRRTIPTLILLCAASAEVRAQRGRESIPTTVGITIPAQATVLSVSSATTKAAPKNTETGTVTVTVKANGAYRLFAGLTAGVLDWMIRSEAQVAVLDVNGVYTTIPNSGWVEVRRNAPPGLNQATVIQLRIDFSKGKRGSMPSQILTARVQPM